MATAAQQQSFINSDLGYATAAAQVTGNSPAEILGQWALETGWGTSYAGKNNPGNVMTNGVAVNYPTFGAGVGAYVSTLQAEGVTGQANNPQSFASSLQAAGYGGTQSNYGQSVLAAIESIPASVNNQQGSSTLNNLSSSNPSIANSGINQLQQNNPNVGANKTTCPAFTIFNPVPWITCSAGNLVLIFLGLVIVVGGIWAIINAQTGGKASIA